MAQSAADDCSAGLKKQTGVFLQAGFSSGLCGFKTRMQTLKTKSQDISRSRLGSREPQRLENITTLVSTQTII